MESLASPLSKQIFVERGGRATFGYYSFEALSRRRRRGRAIQLLQTSAKVGSGFYVFLPLKRTIVRSASPFSCLSAESETHRFLVDFVVLLELQMIHLLEIFAVVFYLQLKFGLPKFSMQANAETVDTLFSSANQSKTVHVKFMLQKACLYGQQFLIVGEDPIFGLWDPSSAMPLEWSDGHIWTVELDLPAGKSIEFKFILRGFSGDITWQPGPDRVLRTWETTNMIIVSEDWNNAENQEIAEESLAIASEQMISSVNKMDTNGAVLSDENQMDMIDESLTTMKYEDNKLINCDGDPVLVPGLTFVPDDNETSEEVFLGEVMNGRIDYSSHASDDEANSSIAEGKPKTPEGNQHEEITIELETSHKDDSDEVRQCYDGLLEEKHQSKEENGTQPEVDVSKNDFLWGRKTLHRLLLKLGLFEHGST